MGPNAIIAIKINYLKSVKAIELDGWVAIEVWHVSAVGGLVKPAVHNASLCQAVRVVVGVDVRSVEPDTYSQRHVLKLGFGSYEGTKSSPDFSGGVAGHEPKVVTHPRSQVSEGTGKDSQSSLAFFQATAPCVQVFPFVDGVGNQVNFRVFSAGANDLVFDCGIGRRYRSYVPDGDLRGHGLDRKLVLFRWALPGRKERGDARLENSCLGWCSRNDAAQWIEYQSSWKSHCGKC